MKNKPVQSRNESDVAYARYMEQAQRKAVPAKPKPVCPEGMSKEEWYASMQPESTKAILTRDPSKDEEHFNRELDISKAQVQKSGDEVLDHVKQRIASYSIDQINHVEAIRRRPKNSIGQSAKSATTKEGRKKAIHNFEVSGRAIVKPEDVDRIIHKLEPITNAAQSEPIEVWKPMTFWQAVRHWLKGGKVERREDKSYGRWSYDEE